MRTAVDDLHDEVRAMADARGRVHAMHVLHHRVPALTLTQVAAYVTALRHGDAPAHLTEITHRELVPPVNPIMTAHTIHPVEPCRGV